MLRDILTKRERNHLKRVIKSNSKQATYIKKCIDIYYGYDTVEGEDDEPVIETFIYIHFLDESYTYTEVDNGAFEGMEFDKKYTLEDLGLC